MNSFLIGLSFLFSATSFATENAKSLRMTKEERSSLEKVREGVEYKSIEIPKKGKNFYLICQDARIQYVLGVGIGQCTALSVSSKGHIQFVPATLYAGYIGAAIEATFSMGKYVKVNNIKNIRDYSSVYFSTDSGAGFIVAASVKHSTNGLNGKTSLGDGDFRGGFGGNLISANLSYVHIKDDQRIMSFKLDEDTMEYL